MHIAVLVPAQSDLSPELAAAAQGAGMEVIDFLWDPLEETVGEAQAFVLLSDERATGARGQALLAVLKAQNLKGKPILGLGAGAARLLVEGGLVPGLYNNMVGLGLSETAAGPETGSEAWIGLTEDYQYNAFTKNFLRGAVLQVERRSQAQFVVPAGLLAELKAQGLDVFIYCDGDGRFLQGLPIAGLANKAGNVMALLPHPEGYPQGSVFFHSLRAHLESGHVEKVEPLYYWPRK